MAHCGVENVNEAVGEHLTASTVSRVPAQVDVVESNSMIEAFWRSLRHQWLYLNDVDTFSTVTSLVEYYVDQHNSVMLHAAFDGKTPDEMSFGTESVADNLPAGRAAAGQRGFSSTENNHTAPARKRNWSMSRACAVERGRVLNIFVRSTARLSRRSG